MTGGLRRLAQEALPALVVAGIVFQLLRLHVADRYLVPSRSMEPTLFGDPERGDVVLVDKTAWWWGCSPQRGDLVVVRNPQRPDADPIVKRLVALGPAYVALRDGDVFAGDDRLSPPRLVKHPSRAADQRVVAFEFDGAAGKPADLGYLREDDSLWRLAGSVIALASGGEDLRAPLSAEAQAARRSLAVDDVYLPGHLATRAPVDTSFLDAAGARLAAFRGFPRDIGLEVTMRLEPGCRAVQLVLEYLETYYSVRYRADGEGVLSVMGEPVGEPFRGPALETGRAAELRFGYLDGRFFMECGGEPVLWHPLELPTGRAEPKFSGIGRNPFANLLHLGCEGGGAEILRLRVFHDIYYQPEHGEPFHLEAGEMFLLGDNTFDSNDSRAIGARFELADLIGRPVAVIAPLPRMRWLSHGR